jgi:hypothetical protein
MEITKHKLCTVSIGKPSDLKDEQCSALPVCYTETTEGVFAVSFWTPTEEELANLNNGHCVTLWVRASGRHHPVVALSTIEREL